MRKLLILFGLLLTLSATGAAAQIEAINEPGPSLINPDVLDKNREENERFTNTLYNQNTDETTMTLYVAYIINVFLGLLGTIFVILIILAGYNWLTAQGDPAKVGKAQTTIRVAVIGLVIIVAAYAITFWIFARLPDNQDRVGYRPPQIIS